MENNKKLLNEEQYQKNTQKLRAVAKVALGIGLAFVVLGLGLTIFSFGHATEELGSAHPDVGSFMKTGGAAIGGWLIVSAGGFAVFVSGILALLAHRREIGAFFAQQSLPLAKEVVDDVTPTVAGATEKLAHGITKGVLEARKEVQDADSAKKAK